MQHAPELQHCTDRKIESWNCWFSWSVSGFGFLGPGQQAALAPLLLGGSSTVMLPVAIWEQMTVANDRAAGAALATAVAVIALFILAIQLRYFNPRRSTQ